MNFALFLTILRIVSIPVFIILYYSGIENYKFWSALVFMIAGITDFFDGYLARKFNQNSILGQFLDPVADKLMVASAIIIVAVAYNDLLITILLLIIILRELAVSSLREWAAHFDRIIQVSNIAKWKTTAQLIALTWLIYDDSLFGIPFGSWSLEALIIASVLSVISGTEYFYKVFNVLK